MRVSFLNVLAALAADATGSKRRKFRDFPHFYKRLYHDALAIPPEEERSVATR
jgi:hypothetical protein